MRMANHNVEAPTSQGYTELRQILVLEPKLYQKRRRTDNVAGCHWLPCTILTANRGNAAPAARLFEVSSAPPSLQ
jgi:hypothetical protein